MKTAIYENRTISLNLWQRENYQTLYEAGKKGKLSCPVCGEQVRFHLGIHGTPRFFHLTEKNINCTDPGHIHRLQSESNGGKYIERNGFKLPVSRKVAVLEKETVVFKEARPVKAPVPFREHPFKTPTISEPYLQLLKNHNIILDEKQMQAVTKTNGAVLVVAGAGSGKTRVLTARTAFMLHEKKIDPRSIMLVTFTAKAANEMKSRLHSYPGLSREQIQRLPAGTFHSLFYRILAFHHPEKWNGDKLLKMDWQKEHILKTRGRELKLDEKEFAYDIAIQQISYWKNSLTAPENVKPLSQWEEQVKELYKYYEHAKKEQGLFDFDDMLLGCYELFSENLSLLEMYQNRFQYFLIDEFQDINKVQYEVIKLLSAKSKNICAVGDDDQSIYSFRGSDPKYLRQFEKDFPNTEIVILNENYRSNHEIVQTANRIIEKNSLRRPKNMRAQLSTGKQPVLFFPFDEEEEATMIVTDIQEKIKKGYQPGDFAILFRTNTESRAVFERLSSSSLPFRIDNDLEPFYERFLVRGMLSFLRLSIDEDNQHAVRDILPALFVRQDILQDLKAESILRDRTLLECLSGIKTGYPFQERKLRRLVPIIRSLANSRPATAIEIVEKELGYNDFIRKRGNEGNKLDKGSDDIRNLKVAAKNFSTIREFIEHTDHMTAMNKEIKKSNKNRNDVISLSTIHRAKGLEYKTVYILGAVDGSIPHDYALEAWRNGDIEPLEEERRLLYVAITRAMEELYLSIPERRKGKKAHPSRFLTPVK